LGALMTPFFATGFPFMAFIAALAVVVETIRWLRGALGNLLYFFMWLAMVFGSFFLNSGLPILGDPMGFKVFRGSLAAAVSAAYPGETIFGYSSVIDIYHNQEFRVFDWSGLDWNLSTVASHWLWVVLALGFVLLSSVWFTRFDPSQERLRLARAKPEEGKGVEPRIKVPHITLPSLSPLVSRLAQVSPFLGVLFAELRMLLNGRRWWWWAIMIVLNFSILGNPSELLEPYLLPLVWLWPLAIWSEMGNRERKYNTYQMVFSSARPVLRQLPAAWLAGVLATALFSFAGAVFFLSDGDLPGLAGWVGAVVFVPSLALALGVVSSSNKAFEVVYVIWWYIGPLQKTHGIDFTSGAPQVYLLAAAGSLLLSMFWRGRQVRV
jgi:hypothetical protein